MRDVIVEDESSAVSLESLGEDAPIFAYRDGVLWGMVVKDGEGWIIKTGGAFGYTGYFKTRLGCLRSVDSNNYAFKTP